MRLPWPSARGWHQHLKLYYGQTRWEDVNKGLKEFQDAAQMYLRGHGILSDFEIKGQIGLFTADSPEEKNGCLAQLPCNRDWNFQKLEQFQQQPTRSLTWLKEMTGKLKAATNNQRAEETIALVRSLAGTPERARTVLAATSTTLFTDDELELLPKITRRYWQRINYCYAMRNEPKKKGVPITREHFAIAFVILDWCCRHPNEDKQQPGNRIMALWKWLYERGHVQQQWDDSRWAAIRNT